MSWYTNYTLGYYDKSTDKIYPLGPFTANGKLVDCISTSASFTTKLKDRFLAMPFSKLSDELFKALFSSEDYGEVSKTEETLRDNYVGYLPLKDLPSNDYLRKGYFLIDNVIRYEKDLKEEGYGDIDDLIYDSITPEEYAIRLHNEMAFGFKPVLDEDGNQMNHSMNEYMYYVFADTESENYDANTLRTFASAFDLSVPRDTEIVVIKTEG